MCPRRSAPRGTDSDEMRLFDCPICCPRILAFSVDVLTEKDARARIKFRYLFSFPLLVKTWPSSTRPWRSRILYLLAGERGGKLLLFTLHFVHQDIYAVIVNYPIELISVVGHDADFIDGYVVNLPLAVVFSKAVVN